MLTITVPVVLQPFKLLPRLTAAFPKVDLGGIQFTDNGDGTTTVQLAEYDKNKNVVIHDFTAQEQALLNTLV